MNAKKYKSFSENESNSIQKYNIEYPIVFHRGAEIEDILLNNEKFKFIDDNKIIELVFVSNEKISLIFQIKKSKNFDKKVRSISISNKYINLIKNFFDFNTTRFNMVKIRESNNYLLNEVSIIIKDKNIKKSNIYNSIQKQLNKVVNLNQNITKDNEKELCYINKIKNINNEECLSGIINENTIFNIYSSSCNLYFYIEISENLFVFNPNGNVQYELILKYFRVLINRLKKLNCNHNIYLIFFSRIFFNYNKNYEKYKFIKQSYLFEEKMFMDIFIKMEEFQSNIKNVFEILQKIENIIFKFKNIKKFNNLNDFLLNLYNNEKKEIKLNENSNSNHNNNENIIIELCNKKIFIDAVELNLIHSIYSNLFESILFSLNEINSKKNSNWFKNIFLLSGDNFPYYSTKLCKIIKQYIFEEYFNISFVFFCSKTKFKKYFINNNINNEHNINDNDININNLQLNDFFKLDNFSHIPPDLTDQCENYFIESGVLDDYIENYNKQFKSYYNQDHGFDKINPKEKKPSPNEINKEFDEIFCKELFFYNNYLKIDNNNDDDNNNNNNNNNESNCKKSLDFLKNNNVLIKRKNKIPSEIKMKLIQYGENRYKNIFNKKNISINCNEPEHDILDFEKLENKLINILIPSIFIINNSININNRNIEKKSLLLNIEKADEIKKLLFYFIDHNFQIITDNNLTKDEYKLYNRKYIITLKLEERKLIYNEEYFLKENFNFDYHFITYDLKNNIFNSNFIKTIESKSFNIYDILN